MSELSRGNFLFTIKRLVTRNKALEWPVRNAYIIVPVILAMAIAAYFLGRHVFDLTVPAEGDVRSHIFKIEILQSYLSQFSWPQWIPWWYHGIPLDQYYPPGFYFLGALLTYVFGHAVIAYKFLLLLTLMLNGLSIFFMARRLFKFDLHLSVWCLLAYQTSTPLLLNFIFGEGPNLLGWFTTVIFLTVYLTHILENRTRGIFNIVWPGFLLGISILIHPFPVIFAFMAVALFHIIWLLHTRAYKNFLRSQLPYIALVFAIGAIIGAYYWLPAFLTLDYSSPIYSFTQYMWPGGIKYLLIIVFLALAAGIITRFKIRDSIRLDFLIACFCLATALGFRATNYLPLDLGSLVQEFRFATIITPFFAILLIAFPLKYFIRLSTAKLALAIVISILVMALAFGLEKRDTFISLFGELNDPGIREYYRTIASLFSPEFPGMVVSLIPYFVIILFFALSIGRNIVDAGRSRPAFVLAGGACLILITSFIPYINTNSQNNYNRIFTHIDYYRQPEYAEVLEAAQDGRLILPPSKGYLGEGDSLVTFGWRWGVETVNGPYNQGDPKFFKSTVHLEWSERWLDNRHTRENLMQESAAKYIFVRGTLPLPTDMNGLNRKLSNKYGRLLELDHEVSRANSVTPILIDVQQSREVTEFFNILVPEGYKWVLVNADEVPVEIKNHFGYVILDSESKVTDYPDKTVILLNNTHNTGIIEDQGIFKLNLPYLDLTNRFFYHGDEADGYWWHGWDNWFGARITNDIQVFLNYAGELISPFTSKFDYSPVQSERTDNRTALISSPGFTLVKDSYFPYWQTDSGTIMSTSQGFMLVYSDAADPVLNYRRPLYYNFAAVCTVLALAGAVMMLIVPRFFRRRQ